MQSPAGSSTGVDSTPTASHPLPVALPLLLPHFASGQPVFSKSNVTPPPAQPLLPTNPDSHLQGRRGRLRTLPVCLCTGVFLFFMIAFKYCLRHLRLCDRASPCVCVSEQMLVGSRECVRRCRGKSWLYLENSVRWSTLSHADGTVKCLGGGRGGRTFSDFQCARTHTQGGRHLRVAATCHARPPCVLAGRGKKKTRRRSSTNHSQLLHHACRQFMLRENERLLMGSASALIQ